MNALRPDDVVLVRRLNQLFGEAFGEPEIALYEKLGVREEPIHFDIDIGPYRSGV